ARNCLLHDVEHHRSIHAVAVAGVPAEKGRSVILRLDTDEPVIASEPPAARVPLHAGADVAGEERLRVVDAERRLLEQAQPTDAASHVRDDGTAIRRRDDHVAAVVQNVGSLLIGNGARELEVLGDAERATDFTLDTDVPVEVDGDRAAQIVVTETGLASLATLREKHTAGGNDADLKTPRARIRFLCVSATRSSDQPSSRNQ